MFIIFLHKFKTNLLFMLFSGTGINNLFTTLLDVASITKVKFIY